jgi:Holliday junction resolvase-like predicted endonuclease
LVGDAVKGGAKVGRKVAKEAAKEALEKTAKEGLEKGQMETVEKATKEAAAKAEKASAEKAANEAAQRADDKALDEAFQGGKDEGAFDTAERLKRGNLGEKLATEALAAEGHKILGYKPSVLGTNQGGIDMVTIKDGFVHFIDNKALSRSGNVSSVSALTTNFAKNKDAVLKELKDALARAASKEEKDVLQSAVTAIEKGNYKRVVTNANLTKNDAILSGVSQALKDKGFEFIDVFKPLGSK